ncbi:MAG: hypothetical protein QOG90_1549 [Actinomycetota bacterium]|jgi:hypothetical protein
MKFAARFAAVLAVVTAVAAGLPTGARALTLRHQKDSQETLAATARWDTADGFISFSFHAYTDSHSADGVIGGPGSSDSGSTVDVSVRRYSGAANTVIASYFADRLAPSEYSWDEVRGVLNVHADLSGWNGGVPSVCSAQMVVTTDSPPVPADTDRGPLHSHPGAFLDPSQPQFGVYVSLLGYVFGLGYDQFRGVSVEHGFDYGSYGEYPGPPYPSSASGSLCGWTDTNQGSHNATIQRTEVSSETYSVKP